MFWRIYLYGVLLILAIVFSVIIGSFFFGRGPHPQTSTQGLAYLLASEFSDPRALIDTDPKRLTALAARLAVLEKHFNQRAAVYTRGGKKLAGSGAHAPPPLPASKAHGLDEETAFRTQYRLCFAAPFDPNDRNSVYLVTTPTGKHPLVRLVLFLLVLLGVVALISYPLARTIARPLEKLTHTAKRLAGGNLDARAALSRRDEVGQLGDTIDHMATELQHRLRTERELLANISHEIRTPLSRIRVAAELCSEPDSDPAEIRRQLEEINADVSELTELIEDVMAVTRLDLAATGTEKGFLPLHKRTLSISQIVAQAKKRFASLHPDHTLAVEYAAKPNHRKTSVSPKKAASPSAFPAGHPPLHGDPIFIRRVLDNLLDNAAKHSAQSTAIALRVTAEADCVRISVCDRGAGVSETDLARLFEPFFRTDRSRGRTSGGSGLGLTLCKRIVEAHGGEITAQRRKKGGLCVTFTLPYAAASP